MIATSFFGVLAVLVAQPLVAVAGCPQGTPSGSYCSINKANYPASNWMARLPDTHNLARLSIPGTHETLAITGGEISQCQEHFGRSADTLTAQLNSGLRAFDIRLRVTDGNKFTIHHGQVYQDANFDDVLTKLRSFLNENNKETVLLRMKRECTGEAFSCKDAEGDFEGILRAYVKDYNSIFWGATATRETDTVPNLGQVRGKIVILVVNGSYGERLRNWGLTQFSDWNDGSSTYVQDEYNVPNVGAIATKRDQVRRFLDKTSAGDRTKIYVNFSSGASAFAHPWSVAAGVLGVTGVNPFLLGYMNEGPEVHPTVVRTGVMMMDFPGTDLIKKIIATNEFYKC